MRLLFGVLSAGILMVTPGVGARDKSDVIVLVNGDQITGEIKNLEYGLLTVSTSYVGTVSVEWIGVVDVESRQLFVVVDTEGARVVGAFDEAGGGGNLVVSRPEGEPAVLPLKRVARISQLERTWRERWRGYVNLGVSLTMANDQSDLTLDTEATYHTRAFKVRSTLSGSISDRADAPRTSWGSLSSNYQRYLGGRWFWYSQIQLDRNEELDLDLRAAVGGGAGRTLTATPRSQLSVSAGATAQREAYTSLETGEWSGALALTGEYELFLFEGRETSLNSSVSVIPSVTDSGRYRVEYSASFQRNLVRDFTIAVTLDGSYDSMPPEGSKASDANFRTSLGWSF